MTTARFNIGKQPAGTTAGFLADGTPDAATTSGGFRTHPFAPAPMLVATPFLAYSIEDFCKMSGLKRSKTYEEIARGNLRLKKSGSRSVVLHAEAVRYLNALPDYAPDAGAIGEIEPQAAINEPGAGGTPAGVLPDGPPPQTPETACARTAETPAGLPWRASPPLHGPTASRANAADPRVHPSGTADPATGRRRTTGRKGRAPCSPT
jgi:hypothetical protein